MLSTDFALGKIPLEKLEDVLANLRAVKERRLVEKKLGHYRPYPKQEEFHSAGASHRERLLMAANRFGKTECGAAEMAYHLTGLYPDTWKGKRFAKPIRAWAAGVTNESTRDVVQEKLIGPPFQESEWGTGQIPKAALGGIVPSRGMAGLIDTVSVKHVSGGLSSLQFKSYERGREKWQGAALEVVWFDEEPEIDIYMEGLTRTNETGGIVFMTFTPIVGVSEVVRRFLHEKSADRAVVGATIDDALHFSEQEKAKVIASYRRHEVEARTRGIPVMGSGRVFAHAEDRLLVDPFEYPTHWTRIGGMDFGWTHYGAFCELWHDRDLDIIYLVRTLRLREQTPLEHVEAVRHWKLRWAWPHDGRNQTLAGAGVPLMKQYADGGLDMLFEHATFEDGSNSVEAGIQMMNDRMRGGRWKVFRGRNDGWLEEYRLYHRDANGLLVKENDDAIAASRYALMMLRHARTNQQIADFNRKLVYPNLGIV
jgi:phage terminase large subunit-like protein